MRVAVIVSVFLAVVTTIWTWWPTKWERESPQAMETEGLLTTGGERVDAQRVASLRVVTWNSTSNEPNVFEVRRSGGHWTIPSHFDYPADGGTRVGQTAGAVTNIPKGPLVTSDPSDHVDLGVVDPLEPGTLTEGMGKRVTLKDEGGAVLVDLIIGNRAPSAEVRYVRQAGDDKVFTAAIKADIRASFKDWVETDLLKLSPGDLRRITIQNYSVNEREGKVEKRTTTTFTRSSADADWLSTQTPPGQIVEQQTMQALQREIDNLRLVGVRPYSDVWLQKRGFYVSRDGTLYGNEGTVQVFTKDGLVYHLFFGEIALGDELDTSEDAPSKSEAAEPDSSHNRYMAVFVQYIPDLNESRPSEPTTSAVESRQDESAVASAPIAVDGADSAAAESIAAGDLASAVASAERQSRTMTITQVDYIGEQAAQRAQDRFGQYFYVISDSSFKKLRPAVDDVFVESESE